MNYLRSELADSLNLHLALASVSDTLSMKVFYMMNYLEFEAVKKFKNFTPLIILKLMQKLYVQDVPPNVWGSLRMLLNTSKSAAGDSRSFYLDTMYVSRKV